MYRISELAAKHGLSRSTLLYYEKLGLVVSRRQANGYRIFSEEAAQQLSLLQQLQAGGLTLKECRACLESSIDRQLLLGRLALLEQEIAAKQQARDLLASLLGQGSMREWHQVLEHQAPEAHLAWLRKQGFNEKQALRLRWLSKDMNAHEQYMADFERIFEGLDRLGPGSEQDTLAALQALPLTPQTTLDIGCGRGISTLLLARHSDAHITALDNDERSLGYLRTVLRTSDLQDRVTIQCASMTDLPFKVQQFDLLWAEGSAYIMGVEQALKSWKPFIRSQGVLVFSDLVWLTEHPSQAAQAYWNQQYPGMVSLNRRLASIGKLGYQLVHSFSLSAQAWENFLLPLRSKVAQLLSETFASNALADIRQELAIHERHLGEYGYQFFVLQAEKC